jgi:hypothetical protein
VATLAFATPPHRSVAYAILLIDPSVLNQYRERLSAKPLKFSQARRRTLGRDHKDLDAMGQATRKNGAVHSSLNERPLAEHAAQDLNAVARDAAHNQNTNPRTT